MPSRYSSAHSVSDAEDLVKRQGLHAVTVPIADIVAAFESELDLHGLAAENLQARVRGTTLMALSNEHGHLVLTTGNKSELATGYSTLYGDSAGGFAPIKDVIEDAGVGAVALAQRAGARARADAADPGELDPSSRRARSLRQASSTPTRCPTTRCSTGCSTTMWSRTWAPRNSSRPGTNEIWWNA